MRQTLSVFVLGTALGFGFACSSSPSPSNTSAPSSQPVTAPTPQVPSTSAPAGTASASGIWKVVKRKDSMSDAEMTIAAATVKGVEGTYELELWLTGDRLNTKYTIYDAEPLAVQAKADIRAQHVLRYKMLQWRFDKDDATRVIASQDDKYANQFLLGAAQTNDVLLALTTVNQQEVINKLAHAQRVLIQGLRDEKEYVEFVFDESFAPFRATIERLTIKPGTQVQTPVGVAYIRNDNVLLFDGIDTTPRVEGEIELKLEKQLPFKGGVALLLMNRGGSDCPYQYRFVFAESSGRTITPEFGTCAALTEVAEKDGSLIVTMPDTPPTTFSFNGYVLLENGKPVKE